MDEPVQIGDKLFLFVSLLGRGWWSFAFLGFHVLETTEVFQNQPPRAVGGSLNQFHDAAHAIADGRGGDVQIFRPGDGHVGDLFIFLEKL